MHTPKGKLIAIGGNEDKGTDPEPNTEHGSNINFFGLQILSRIVQEAGGKEARIEIITTASSIPEEVGENYQAAFEKLGATDIGVMHIKQRDDTSDKNYLERIRKCNAILFTG